MRLFPFVHATALFFLLGLEICQCFQYTSQFFDLGYQLDSTNLFWPGQRFNYELFKDVHGFNSTNFPEPLRYWFATYSFCMGEHGGTHMDAPTHFNKDGWTPAEIPLNRLMDVRAVVIDVEQDVFSLPDPRQFSLEVHHVQDHERKHGKIEPGSVLLIRTGWDRYWPDKRLYWGIENGKTFFPGLSAAVCEWLVKERSPVGVGIDTQSIDIGHLLGAPMAHIILTGHQVYLLENVANLKTLLQAIRPQATAYPISTAAQCDLRLVVMPIKSAGTGGPARVIAYCKSVLYTPIPVAYGTGISGGYQFTN